MLGAGAPVSGSQVRVYAAGSDGYGSGARLLASGVSAEDGRWSLAYDCPDPTAQIYATASGGSSPGASDLPRLAWLSFAGACGSAAAQMTLNELSTVAAGYALSQFLDASGSVAGAPATNALGLANAVTVFRRLVDPATGMLAASVPESVTLPAAGLHTLANALSACAQPDDGMACEELLAAAAPPDAPAPATALEAALAVARHPGHNVAQLYQLAAGTSADAPVYAPTLQTAPGDWLLALRVAGSGLRQPAAVAIDAHGNAWAANFDADASVVSKFAPDGAPLSGSDGFTGGGLRGSLSIAIDAQGNAWVSNQQSTPEVNAQHGSITKLAPDGTVLSGSGYFAGGVFFPYAVAIDENGDAWIANYGNSTISKLAPDGSALSPPEGFDGGGLGYPAALAVDASGSVWVSNFGTERVSLLGSDGVPVSPDEGYAGDVLRSPGQICLDRAGDAWLPNFLRDDDGYYVTRLAGAATGIAGTPLSPQDGYRGGGLFSPFGCAIDGAGNLWITNFHGASLTLLSGSDGAMPGEPLSGEAGYARGELSQPYGIAIDASGNVWVANYGDDSLLMLPGAARPVRTPLIGPPILP